MSTSSPIAMGRRDSFKHRGSFSGSSPASSPRPIPSLARHALANNSTFDFDVDPAMAAFKLERAGSPSIFLYEASSCEGRSPASYTIDSPPNSPVSLDFSPDLPLRSSPLVRHQNRSQGSQDSVPSLTGSDATLEEEDLSRPGTADQVNTDVAEALESVHIEKEVEMANEDQVMSPLSSHGREVNKDDGGESYFDGDHAPFDPTAVVPIVTPFVGPDRKVVSHPVEGNLEEAGATFANYRDAPTSVDTPPQTPLSETSSLPRRHASQTSSSSATSRSGRSRNRNLSSLGSAGSIISPPTRVGRIGSSTTQSPPSSSRPPTARRQSSASSARSLQRQTSGGDDSLGAFNFPPDPDLVCHWIKDDGEECGKVFGRKPDCTRHYKTHLGDWPCDVPGCEEVLSRRDALRRHRMNVHSL